VGLEPIEDTLHLDVQELYAYEVSTTEATSEEDEVRLAQGDHEWATPGDAGRFEFEGVSAGLSRLRMVLRPTDGGSREVMTPQFEV